MNIAVAKKAAQRFFRVAVSLPKALRRSPHREGIQRMVEL